MIHTETVTLEVIRLQVSPLVGVLLTASLSDKKFPVDDDSNTYDIRCTSRVTNRETSNHFKQRGFDHIEHR